MDGGPGGEPQDRVGQAAGEHQGQALLGRHPLAERLLGILVNLGQICVPLLLLLLPCLASLGSVSSRGHSIGLGLSHSLHLEHDEVPHKPGLQQADSNQGVQSEEAGVKVAGGQVNHLLLHGGLGQAVPEGEYSQDDGGEAGQDEEEVPEPVELAGDVGPLGVGQDTAGVEDDLGQVVDNQQRQGEPGEAEHVGGGDEDEVEGGVLDLGCHVLSLCLLEVKLWEDVEPVGDLDDEEELEEEGHVVMGISIPQSGDIEEVLPQDDVSAPEQRHDIESQQLSGFIKLGVLDLGQVELLVDLVQQVLLDDGVHHNGDQQIEKHSGDVLDTSGVEGEVLEDSGLDLHRSGDIVMQRDENRCQG